MTVALQYSLKSGMVLPSAVINFALIALALWDLLLSCEFEDFLFLLKNATEIFTTFNRKGCWMLLSLFYVCQDDHVISVPEITTIIQFITLVDLCILTDAHTFGVKPTCS